MTQFEGERPNSSTDPDDSVSSLEPALDPQVEAELRTILADLPPVTMPDEVFTRLQSAIAAEPHPAAGSPNVTRLHARRNRTFLAIAGVAAAGVLGVYVGSTLMHESENNPTLASVAPVSMSDTVYQGGTLASQVSAKLPSWKTATPAHSVSGSPSATGHSASSSPSATATSYESEPSAGESTVTASMRQAVLDCLGQIDQRTPMHVDIAKYKAGSDSPEESVAVATVKGGDEVYDVYFVAVTCSPSATAAIRDHLQIR